jgi:hypothetical protein
MGDVWKPKELWDSRYQWMPLDMNAGAMHLPAPEPWQLNIRTGEVAIQK